MRGCICFPAAALSAAPLLRLSTRPGGGSEGDAGEARLPARHGELCREAAAGCSPGQASHHGRPAATAWVKGTFHCPAAHVSPSLRDVRPSLGVRCPLRPRSKEALRLAKQEPRHTRGDGGSGPHLRQLDCFKVPPHPCFPLTLPYSDLSALQQDGPLHCPLQHLRTFSGSLLPSGHSLGFFTQPTRPVRSGSDPTHLDTSTGP